MVSMNLEEKKRLSLKSIKPKLRENKLQRLKEEILQRLQEEYQELLDEETSLLDDLVRYNERLAWCEDDEEKKHLRGIKEFTEENIRTKLDEQKHQLEAIQRHQ